MDERWFVYIFMAGMIILLVVLCVCEVLIATLGCIGALFGNEHKSTGSDNKY